MKLCRMLQSLSIGLISTDAAAQGAPGAAVTGGQIAQVMLGLVGVLALILVFAWLARSVFRVQPAASGQLRILGGLSMGSREKVVLLQVGGQQLVLGVAPGRITTLHVLDEPVVESEHAAGAGLRFAGLLSRYQAGASRQGGK